MPKSIIVFQFTQLQEYKSLIDSYWHYLYNPTSEWAKFCKIVIFLLTVHHYIVGLGEKAKKDNPDGYYNMLKECTSRGEFEVSAIATTNYNNIIEDILGDISSITYLNGSVSVWYDPYLNKMGKKIDLDNSEHHLLVPLMFTQSGTKPMTSISMAEKYVDVYHRWEESDAVVIVGFGFGDDDEHINGILRTLVNDDGKQLNIVTLKNHESDSEVEQAQKVAKKLKIADYNKIKMILVDEKGKINGKPWTEYLE